MFRRLPLRLKGDSLFRFVCLLFSLSLFLLIALLVFKLTQGSWLSLTEFGFRFFVGKVWDPVHRVFGVLPLVYGTAVSSLLALLLAVPVSLGTAIFLNEFAPLKLRQPMVQLIELIAAIPSVILGFWGLLVLAPFLRNTVEPWLGRHLGFLPLFQGPPLGIGMLNAGLMLALMLLPIITALSREAIRQVPVSLREAMLALGATRWEVIWNVVLPCARSGVIAAVILGLGRALGETMVVAMVLGNRPQIKASLFAPAATLTSVPINEFAEADYPLYTSAIIEAGLVLLILTLAINVLARLLIWRTGIQGRV